MHKFLIILLPILCFSQNKIIPKNGKISFTKHLVITDKIAFESTTEKISIEMLKIFEKNLLVEKKDTLSVKKIINQTKEINICKDFLLIEEDPCEFGNIYKDNWVKYFVKENGKKLLKPYELNKDFFKGEFSNQNYKIHKIEKISNDTKTIKGFTCSKIIVTFTEICEEGEVPCAYKSLPHYWEMWGTSQIDTKIHPVILDSTILENFYPLHIIQTIEGIDGYQVVYELKTLKFK
jgi:hypothetical protein